ncbi:MAG: hypothetical protein KF767_15100 [Bdellovibrionaceae bacterium]|nr:hypothetical protein [Pseudobdellovibrionaceae bacterium]
MLTPKSLKSILFLMLIFSPVAFLARTLVANQERVEIYEWRENGIPTEKAVLPATTGPKSVSPRAPANVPEEVEAVEIDMDAAANWSLPEKFLPELREGEWVTQSFQDEREVFGRKLKLIVLIDLRRVKMRGKLSGVQFREPRFFIEGSERAIVFRHLDLVFNAQKLSAIQAYHDLNVVVPEGELVSLGTEGAKPLVVLPLNEGGNFLGIKISELEVFEVRGGERMVANGK